jgi:hypothetical protein
MEIDIRRYWKSATFTKLSKVWKLLQKEYILMLIDFAIGNKIK